MRRFFPAFLALITFTMPAVAQAKHPFTFEDMMKLRRVGEPEVSPDGKWVIFSVVDVDLEANTKTPHIWIVATAGGQEREIIADQDADRPRGAPDGKRFAFISTKEGGSQVWVAQFDNTAGTVTRVWKLTSVATEAGGEVWSPDAKNILFTSDVYPECDAQDDPITCNAKMLDEANKSKVQAQIFTHLLYRHWNAYKEGKRSHIFAIEAPPAVEPSAYAGRPVVRPHDLTPGDHDAPVFSLGGQDNYAFSPDGQEICYTSNHDKNPAASTNNDLWIVPVSGGPAGSSQEKNITADNPASDSTPLYSPDGRYIAYRAQQRPGYESDRFRLMLYDRKTGEKKDLTENFGEWGGTYAWSPDSKVIYFSAGEGGYQPLFRVGLDDLVVVRVMAGTYDDLDFAPDGRTLALTQNSIAFPSRIDVVSNGIVEGRWAQILGNYPKGTKRINLTGVEPRTLADPDAEILSRVSMSPIESFYFTGAHNDKVE